MALGIVGGIFGLLGALFAIFVGAVAEAFTDDSTITALGWSALLFGTLGIVGGSISAGKPKAGGWLMLVSAVGGLISISFYYILPCILLAIGGILSLVQGRKNRQATSGQPYATVR